MFKYDIPEDIIKTVRRELCKDFHSKKPIVRRFERRVDKISSKHAKYIWLIVFFSVLLIETFSLFNSSSAMPFNFFLFFGPLLLIPTVAFMFAKPISIHLFCKKHHIPDSVPVYMPPSSTSFSRSSFSDSTISVNPANGLPMCGSVDINGNAPGHSRSY